MREIKMENKIADILEPIRKKIDPYDERDFDKIAMDITDYVTKQTEELKVKVARYICTRISQQT